PAPRAPPEARGATSGRSREPFPGELDERATGPGLGAPGGTHELDLALQVEPFHPGLGERPRLELRLDRGARDERHAVPGADGARHRLLQAQLEPHAEVAQAQAAAMELVLDHEPYAGT